MFDFPLQLGWRCAINISEPLWCERSPKSALSCHSRDNTPLPKRLSSYHSYPDKSGDGSLYFL